MSELHVVKSRGKRKILKPITPEEIQKNLFEGKDGVSIDSDHLLISMLLPPAVRAFYAELESEVEAICGARHSRIGDTSRWGSQPGSITLGNQKVSIERPRVRGPGGEVPLATYARFQDPSLFDQQVFEQGLKRVSQRD